jgi:acyl transferase domain-containing protein/3-hydroxymyristoyl/3-hydroxydecanoyl-(acyl carrier protein) dehydratase
VTGDPKKAAAVVALGIMVPGANDPGQFWEMILSGRTAFRAAKEADFGADPSLFYDPADPPALDKAYSLTGAWIDGRPDPTELEGLKLLPSFDPQEADDSLLHWLLAGRRAVGEKTLLGHDPAQVGVVAGHVVLPTKAQSEAAVSLYGREATRDWDFNPFAPPPKTNPFRAVGYSARLLAKALGLTGPAYTVDAACASSLYAVRLALDGLLSGQLTAAVTGGLAQADPLFTQLGFSQLRALSRAGVSRPFDRRADGLVVGSGAVAIVLKTLDRALADGDEVLAVLLSVGLGNDQTGNLLAPDPKGQARAMAEAFRLADRSPKALGLVEAHGTSTVLGDKVEVASIKAFLKGQKLNQVPALGSVKSNVGHLLSAAGAAALAKVALALKAKVLPPTAGFENPSVDLAEEPALRVLTQGEPWPDPAPLARLATVNAFGFGGVNAQAVLEEYRPELWGQPRAKKAKPPAPLSAALIASRTVLAPWPSYETLARFWLTPEEPPMAQTRRLGALKTTGFFFQDLTVSAEPLKLPPKELAECLPQQTIALKAGLAAIAAAGLEPGRWPKEVSRERVGVFMGVEIDPRAADLALRWTAPHRAAEALAAHGLIAPAEIAALAESFRATAPPPLTHSRVLGALGSFVASRLARYLGAGGPAFTLSEERDSGFRALYEAVRQLVEETVDLAVVGVVDTFGDPKTGYLAPRTVWVEGAAVMVLAGPKAAKVLPPLGRLTLNAAESRIGPLSGLFALNRNAFYLRHHLKPLGRGHGMAYWLKNPAETRVLAGPGYELAESQERPPSTLTVPPDPIRPDVWFYFKDSKDRPLAEGLNRLAALLEANPNRELTRLSRDFWAQEADSWALSGAGPKGRPALAIQARDGRELTVLLKKALTGEEDRDLKPRVVKAPNEPVLGQLAFVFPGAGNVYKGLGRGLALAFPAVMGQLEAETLEPVAQFQSELFWAPNPKKPGCREAILGQVNFGLLATRVLESLGVKPQAALGYSLGETAALVALGLWPDRDELYQSLMRSTLFSKDLTGELASPRAFWSWPTKKALKWSAGLVPRSEKAVHKALDGLAPSLRFRVYALIVNTAEEICVGGEAEAVAALAQALEAPFFPIEEVAAVHAPTVGPVKEAYWEFHRRPIVPRPDVKIYSAAWAKAYEPTAELTADSLTAQALKGHRFPDLVNQAYADGIRYFVEIGPGSSATRLVKAILGERPHLAASVAGTAVDEGWAEVSRILSELWLYGQIPDPFRGQPQPSPEPDPRFIAAIVLDPPSLSWPPVAPLAAEEPKEEEPKEDFMNWLNSQTKKPAKAVPPPAAGQASPTLAESPASSALAESSASPALAAGQASPALAESSASPALAAGQASPALAESPADLADSQGPLAATAGHPGSRRRRPKAAADPAKATADLAPTAAAGQAPTAAGSFGALTRADCLEFALGSIEKVLGPEFREVDSYPYRVKLPADPLMLVDRVLAMEGEPKTLGPGRIVTEKDVQAGDWYLEEGRISPGMAIESGQADLLLSAYLGADFSSQGLARYRLLDAEVAFLSDPPAVGETARYDIKIARFFRHGETLMFRFEFDGQTGGRPLLTMREGRAGFFTQKALEAGRGLPAGLPRPAPAGPNAELIFAKAGPNSLSRAQTEKLRQGDLKPLGRAFPALAPGFAPLPAGQLALFDSAPKIDRSGGLYGRGFVRAEAAVDPKAWYLTSHFPGDEVMPGTLMYDAALQALRLFLLTLGWLPGAGAAGFRPALGVPQSLRCRGQVTPKTREVAYEVHVRELSLAQNGNLAEPQALAEAIMWADGRPIAEVRNLGLRLAGAEAQDLAQLWAKPAKKIAAKGRPAGRPGAAQSGSAALASHSATEANHKATEANHSTTEANHKATGANHKAKAERHFDKARLNELILGSASKSLGPAFARFDDGSFVARLPKAPYDFVDEALVVQGQAGQVSLGTTVEAAWRPDPNGWVFQKAGGRSPILPYAALNEVALQACGFLSAYMGTALLFDEAMYFRNLGGEATVLNEVGLSQTDPLVTRATLTKSSSLGQMTIQHYEFATAQAQKPIYEGQTHFGFFNLDSLTRQRGLKADPALAKALKTPPNLKPIPYPVGPAWPAEKWRTLEELWLEPEPRRIWARSRVNPNAWFFAAHFPGDPVWPGSLGLEGFLQAAKYLAVRRYYPGDPAAFPGSFGAPLPGRRHAWLYRGQIPPTSQTMSLGLLVSQSDPLNRALTFNGLLSVDGLVVYQVDDFTVGLRDF